MKSWCKSVVFTLLLLILIFPRYPVEVKRASIAAEKDISDEHIDEILWEFLKKWEPEDHIIEQFKSTMMDILRLFAGIDSRKLGELMFRIRIRLASITRLLREQKHPKHVHNTFKKL